MIKGVFAVAAGIVALVWPGPTVVTLVVVLGIYVLVDSVISLVNARAMRGLPGSRLMALLGVAGIVMGLLMLWHPGPLLRVLVVLTAAWVTLVGLGLALVAVPLMPLTRRAWLWPLAAGVVCLVLGVIGLVHPGFGVAALGWLIGLGVMVYGAAHIGLAVGMRHLTGVIGRAGASATPTVIEGEVVPEDSTGSHHDSSSGGPGDGPVIEGRVE
ncbi:Uncharacterized conserved protein [Acidipropionibacterium jensenii]|uniref:Uncharacterized conserved protein n=2 Tax=Acidipropionibacterium jensenii TaxID=1749 RepID=A0A3S4UPJ8_9ACTN|nr:DUF308 domain-containing protein [Acidipropionibacterium jensenii]VEI02173.1 Uncharacterized conserved protein [Acidipropionibacterium jensenii]